MAHVVGVPRRDPCQKCQLPVFLAERLTVGKKVFHRTCLKCARCGSQLTPGSFYETEVDNEYCCETCPDEEFGAEDADGAGVLLRNSNVHSDEAAATAAAASKNGARTSIADCLAFFEQSSAGAHAAADHKLLQKSVSDEEKSASLKRMEGGGVAADTTMYRGNAALSSFLSDTLDVPPLLDVQTESASITLGKEKSGLLMDTATTTSTTNTTTTATTPSTTTHSSDEEDDEDASDVELHDVPPALPSTLPPVLEALQQQPVGSAQTTPTPAKRYTATAQLQLDTNGSATSITDDGDDVAESDSVVTLRAHDSNDSVHQQQQQKRKTEIQLTLTPEPPTDTTTTTAASVTNDMENNNHNTNNSAEVATKVAETEEAGVQEVVAGDPQVQEDTHELQTNKLLNTAKITSLELSETNDNDCVTKDEDADIVMEMDAESDMVIVTTSSNTTVSATAIATKAAHDAAASAMHNGDGQGDEAVELRAKPVTGDRQPPVDAEVTERLSVVRARLQQFEVIATNNNKATHNSNHNHNNSEYNNNANDKHAVHTNTSATAHAAAKRDDSVDATNVTSPDNSDAPPARVDDVVARMQVDVDSNVVLEEIANTITTITALAPTTTTTTATANKVEENVNVEDEVKLKAMDVDQVNVVEQTQSLNEVPLVENDIADDADAHDDEEQQIDVVQPQPAAAAREQVAAELDEQQSASKTTIDEYPEEFNPFKSDDDEHDDELNNEAVLLRHNKENISPRPKTLQTTTNVRRVGGTTRASTPAKTLTQNLNPFDSSDDEIELEKSRGSSTSTTPSSKVPPPRPPPPRVSRNPFGDETDEETSMTNLSRGSSLKQRTPVPAPRSSNVSQSGTPEPTPRLSTRSSPQASAVLLQNSAGDYYGSANSLGGHTTSTHVLQRNSEYRGSNNSLTSSSGGGTIRSRKSRKAPAPPAPSVRELFPENGSSIGVLGAESKTSTPSSSTVGTPKSGRKKRPAPAPPKPARLDPHSQPQIILEPPTTAAVPKNSHSYPLQSDLESSKLSDEEKALLEGKQAQVGAQRSSLRLIPLDASLLQELRQGDGEDDGGGNALRSQCDDLKQQHEETNVVYRRSIAPLLLDTPIHERNALSHDSRQLEKLKDNKEAQNRNRQSQISATSSGTEDGNEHGGGGGGSALYSNKSAHGKWKRRKGPAPALPIPPRKVLQMLPLQEIRHELDIIEVQQQGLEKQGVILEKMIRDRCEGREARESLPATSAGDLLDGGNGEGDANGDNKATVSSARESVQNSKEVEDLILQLFELVNEKNELFRRQAELMYLRRQHRLEQEQADLEYEIRVLMAQPERNKTDSDKAREEALIARLVEVVQLRNEVIECLEMDRLREAEEDLSIKQRLELHTAKREEDECDSKRNTAKLSKKEKKKQKEAKKLCKSKKIDADKDADESELGLDKDKLKKKKKKFLF